LLLEPSMYRLRTYGELFFVMKLKPVDMAYILSDDAKVMSRLGLGG